MVLKRRTHEDSHPQNLHLAGSNLLLVLLLVLGVQFVAKVYAMNYSLLASTSEQKDTLQVIVADLDGDGDNDVAAFNYDTTSADDHDVYLNGAGTLTHYGTMGDSNGFKQAAGGDIDGDGDIDFVAVTSNGNAIVKEVNDGSANFTSTTIASALSYAPQKVMLTDVDHDGDLDMIVGNTSTAVTQAVYLNDGSGTFTAAASTLPQFKAAAVTDVDSDGNVDLVVTNPASGLDYAVYKGTGTGAFYRIGTENGLSGGNYNYVDMRTADMDGDGDIDIVMTVETNASTGVQYILKNNGAGTFTYATEFGDTDTSNSAAVGDIDNDGDLDVLNAGVDNVSLNGGVQVFLNNGSATSFTQNGSTFDAIYCTYAIATGDFDADDDLDFIAGNAGCGSGFGNGSTEAHNRHYVSDQAATLANTAPTAPSSDFSETVTTAGGTNLRLSWGSGSDTETATKMLQYRLKVGTATAGNNIVSGAAASPNWVSRVMPNGQSRTYLIKNITCNQTYYWSVAAVDTGFRATWSTERSVTLDASCAIASGAAPPPDTGGGLPAWFFKPAPAIEEVPATGTITLTAFKDANADGKRQPSEEPSFRGLRFTASGSTADGVPHTETAVINEKGVLSFVLPPSDPRGYAVLVSTGSSLLQDVAPTTPLVMTGIVLKPNAVLNLDIGFKRIELLRYDPCIRIGSTRTKGSTDAETFLLQLEDAFGNTVVPAFSGSLVQRGAFFSALRRTQCIPLVSDPEKLKAVARSQKTSFVDLLPDASPDSSLAYTLLEKNISIGRGTKIGSAADFSSPVTRREALQAIFDALHPSAVVSTGSALPLDLSPDDSLVPVFFTLRHLGVLPEHYASLLGPSLGLTSKEASLLLARAAFRAGTVPLETPTYAESSLKPSAPPKANPTFLSLVPTFSLPPCLELHPDRRKNVTFTDILPGDPLERDLRTLLAYGSASSDEDRTVWLLSGTLRPTERGVEKGQTRLRPSDPVSLLEALRNLVVLSCLPMSSDTEIIQGSGETNVPRDRLADLPRDDSFASRVLYATQDHQRKFDLSLFTYAPSLLRGEARSPADPLNIEEASELLASALLRLAVDREALSPQDAENLATELSSAILRDFLGYEVDWTNERALRTVPFTREMFIRFLSIVVTGRTIDLPPDPETTRPLGQIWWERVK